MTELISPYRADRPEEAVAPEREGLPTHAARAEMPAPCVIFLHNLKTGGTTLRQIISRHYEPSTLRTTDRVTEVKRLVEQPNVRALQGHLPFGVHQFVPGPATYATLLRDPVERMLSLYYFFLERERHNRHKEARSLGLREFVTGGRMLETDNGQTRRLSGMDPEFGQCSREMLDLAKANLERAFSVVGTTEKFDETLLLMQRAFGWRSVLYLKRKVTKRNPERETVSPEDLRAIVTRNELDTDLYAHARQLLDDAIARQGPRFEGEVRRFKLLNGVCQEWARATADRVGHADVILARLSVRPDEQRELWAMILDSQVRLLDQEDQPGQNVRRALTRAQDHIDYMQSAHARKVEALQNKLRREQEEIRKIRSSRIWRLGTRYRRARGWIAAERSFAATRRGSIRLAPR